MTMRDPELQYYEIPELWDPMLYGGIQAERTSIAAQWIPEKVNSILDIGCGNGLLANQLGRFRLVIGADRSKAALQYIQAHRCQADVASLPFPDACFDLVVALELIEHLPEAAFDAALNELARVTRSCVLIMVPYQEDLVSSTVRCPHCTQSFHPNHHQRSFNEADLQDLFCAQDQHFSCVRVAGVVTRPRYVMSSELKRLLGIKPLIPWYATCPHCGHRAGNPPVGGAARADLRGRLLAHLKTSWPQRTTYFWWLALYERDVT